MSSIIDLNKITSLLLISNHNADEDIDNVSPFCFEIIHYHLSNCIYLRFSEYPYILTLSSEIGPCRNEKYQFIIVRNIL